MQVPLFMEDKMDKKLLMLHGAKYAVLKMMSNGSCLFAKKINNSWQTINWSDIEDYLDKMIDEYKVERCNSCKHWICDNGGHLCALTNYGDECKYEERKVK